MRSRALRLAFVLGATLISGSVLLAGGWAVVTVQDLPDHVTVGTPVTLRYVVRQHGVTLLSGLAGEIEARSGFQVVRAAAAAGPKKGFYAATLTLPAGGWWTVEIDSGFMVKAGTTRITLAAIAPGSTPPVLSEASRGRVLFAAKGCATCHTHPDVAPLESRLTLNGPRLGAKKYQPDFLKTFLANPSATRLSSEEWRMPNLELREAEIGSLVAFLTAKHSAVDSAALVRP
jgi:mono/diheme cytochrome c family protein